MESFSFAVLPQEQNSNITPAYLHVPSNFDEDESGTKFVEVIGFQRYDGKYAANFYYRNGFAKYNTATIEELKIRFPRSFSQECTKDSGELYEKTLPR